MLKVLLSLVITTTLFSWFLLVYVLWNINPILGAGVMIFLVIWGAVYMAVLDIWED